MKIPFNVFMQCERYILKEYLSTCSEQDVIDIKNKLLYDDGNVKDEVKNIISKIIDDFNNKWLDELDQNVSDFFGLSTSRIDSGCYDTAFLVVELCKYEIAGVPFIINIGEQGAIELEFAIDSSTEEDFYDTELIDLSNININELGSRILRNTKSSLGSPLECYIDEHVGTQDAGIILDIKNGSTSFNASKVQQVYKSLTTIVEDTDDSTVYTNIDEADNLVELIKYIINNYECEDPDNLEALKNLIKY